jgi:hypothetical protein
MAGGIRWIYGIANPRDVFLSQVHIGTDDEPRYLCARSVIASSRPFLPLLSATRWNYSRLVTCRVFVFKYVDVWVGDFAILRYNHLQTCQRSDSYIRWNAWMEATFERYRSGLRMSWAEGSDHRSPKRLSLGYRTEPSCTTAACSNTIPADSLWYHIIKT